MEFHSPSSGLNFFAVASCAFSEALFESTIVGAGAPFLLALRMFCIFCWNRSRSKAGMAFNWNKWRWWSWIESKLLGLRIFQGTRCQYLFLDIKLLSPRILMKTTVMLVNSIRFWLWGRSAVNKWVYHFEIIQKKIIFQYQGTDLGLRACRFKGVIVSSSDMRSQLSPLRWLRRPFRPTASLNSW